VAFVAAAAPFLAMAGAGVSAAGTIAGGIASQNASNYQAAVANNNSIVAQQNAVHAEQAGEVSAENQSLKGAAEGGKVKVAQAANGVNVNSGSALDVQVGERETNQLNTETVFQNDLMQAYGYRVQSENFQSEAALDKAKADEAVPAAVLSATGSLLSSASGIGGKWSGSLNANSLFGGGSPSGYGA
jgi:hypothetical protein